MYKPQTVEQFKILQELKKAFDMGQFILSPVSRCSLMLGDTHGEKIAFSYKNGQVEECKIPEPISNEERRAYIRSLKHSPSTPQLRNYAEITRWWLNTPNPLTHQQALGLSNELYRHYLTHKLLDEEDIIALVSKNVVTEDQYNDILIWYFNGNFCTCWFGPYGVDGTGNSYKLTLNYGKPNEQQYVFYVQDEYYCFMNGLPYPYTSK